MDLRATILGILSWKSASGYDLKRIISDSDIFYWSGNNNQIYKTLLELQNEGRVTNEVQVQEKLPAKKIYSITESGLVELRQSLLAEPELPEAHKGFLIQMAWAELLSDAEVLQLLEQYEAEIAARLRMTRAKVEAHTSELVDNPGRSSRERYLWRRIAENLATGYQAEIDWVRQTLDDLHTGNYQKGKHDEHNH